MFQGEGGFMKVTKVDRKRIAVVSKPEKNTVLYPSTMRADDKIETASEQIKNRVAEANKLYSVFFSGKQKNQGNDVNTSDLEKKFTWLIKDLLALCNEDEYLEQETKKACIESQIKYLLNLKRISQTTSSNITDDVLDQMIVRMRKPLKRGSNEAIVKKILAAFATKNIQTFRTVIEDLNQNQHKEFVRFIDSINKDYYKVNLVKSINNHNTKVQKISAESDLLDLPSVNNTKAHKEEITLTLKEYASSKDGSDKVLMTIKSLFFEYFFSVDLVSVGRFNGIENIWKMPTLDKKLILEEDVIFGGYFDEGFVVSEKYKNDWKYQADNTLELLLKAENLNKDAIKARVNFVNVGRYLELKEIHKEDKITGFWLNFAKDYVERHYVKVYKNNEQSYLKIEMFQNCWKEAIRYICSKYIDVGKAVYHFTLKKPIEIKLDGKEGNTYQFGLIQDAYKDGISSFEYEIIKAEETLQREISTMVIFATTALTHSAIDEDALFSSDEKGKEDILFFKGQLEKYLKSNAKKQLLRYYGGASTIQEIEEKTAIELLQELMSHIKMIRNDTYHHAPAKKEDIKRECTDILWEAERKSFQTIIRKKYYSNNVADFYKKEDIKNLVINLYGPSKESGSHIPAFRNIWKRKDLPQYIDTFKNATWCRDAEVKEQYEGALYFLLKEIYYRSFITDKFAKKCLDKVIENNYFAFKKRREDKNAVKDFEKFLKSLPKPSKNRELTLAEICQYVNGEYNQQNAKQKKNKEEIYKHFKMLLPVYIKEAFIIYLKEKNDKNDKKLFAWIRYPKKYKDDKTYLDKMELSCIKPKINQVTWYTFAHFIHPKQLNLLLGNIKNYVQFRNDISRRAYHANQISDEEYVQEKNKLNKELSKYADIIKILDFVRIVNSRELNCFEDYYDSKEDYAKYLQQYIAYEKLPDANYFDSFKEFCRADKTTGKPEFAMYTDEANPKLLRNIEIARMYGLGNMKIPENKISQQEIEAYYELENKTPKTEKEKIEHTVKLQKMKNRITLYEAVDLNMMVNDLLGELVSLNYLRERDQMYLFLGFYYMALRNEMASEKWNEVLDSVEDKNVVGGLVLHQVVSLFDFPINLLYKKNNKWEQTTGVKWGHFISNHNDSYTCIMRLFTPDKYLQDCTEVRNYVDHAKYYANYERSILQLYSEFYAMLFTYSTKLRHSVLFNFANILEKYNIDPEKAFYVNRSGYYQEDKSIARIMLNDLNSKEFTYKYTEGNKNLELKLDARTDTFLIGAKKVLEYFDEKK